MRQQRSVPANRPATRVVVPVIERADWLDPRILTLRTAMDAEMSALYSDSLAVRSPELQDLLGAAFAVEPVSIVATVLATIDGVVVGQAGLRPWPVGALAAGGVLEVKKVFVDEAFRGRGVSRLLMGELEAIATELGATSLILQTGDLQPAAIALYESLGYERIPPYPPFELMDNALCYEKRVTPANIAATAGLQHVDRGRAPTVV